MQLDFVKMHGLGNDFVVFDARSLGDGVLGLTAAQARHLADRRFGIGCDQILIIAESPECDEANRADIALHIFNSDGSRAEACGNGSRCVAALVMTEKETTHLSIATEGGVINATMESPLIKNGEGNDKARDEARVATARVSVDMGVPRTAWDAIPLAYEMDTMAIDLGYGGLPPAIGVNMGNPHAVHIVEDAEAIDLAAIGAALERHAVFPEGANIEFASKSAEDTLRMRVWERGSGITIACGTGACAAAVAAIKAGLVGRRVTIVLDGGRLEIEWQEGDHEDGHVIMTGAAVLSFRGRVTLPQLNGGEPS